MFRIKQLLIALGLFFFANAINATTLTAAEQQLVVTAKSYQPAELALLQQLVNINSGTDNIAGVMEVGNAVKKQFQQLGFKTYWVSLPKSMHRAPTLIAERKGTQGKRVLLIGHLDTVFSKNHPFQKMSINNNVASGPGVGDDKGGIVVILYVLKALQSIHALDNKSITVVLTGDEENAGKPIAVSRRALLELAQTTDVALDFEPATENNSATLSRRGISNWLIEVQGKEAHSASVFQKETGAGAAFELARILNTMREWVQRQEMLTFNVGVMEAGNQLTFVKDSSRGTVFGKNNIVSKVALASGDFRYLSVDEKQAWLSQLQHIIANHLPQTKGTLTVEDAIPPMPITTNNINLLEQFSQASKDIGYGSIQAVPPTARGAADISHIAAIVPANLGGLGVVGDGFHTKHENIAINSLSMQTARAALLIYRLTLK